MDKAIRTVLRNTVTRCRKLLEDAIFELLQGQFGIHRDGQIEETSQLSHLSNEDMIYRKQVIIHLKHIQAADYQPDEAVNQLVREVAFTHLNRLCAYKILEQRKLIRESVSRGMQSNGFKFYLADHPEEEILWSSGQQEVAYRHFLEWLGSTLTNEINLLFSPNDPANRLFLPHRVTEQVLGLINNEDLADVWSEDETIGWIYQYFTPKELRDQARKESQAPRNAEEMAFRNQFYTPRYVVQFLVDNTLGRLWYEMREGNTILKEKCLYLIQRPNEVFTKRAKKDPRDFKIMDPACGSGHFLLYCFDLLQCIYQEAYEDKTGPAFTETESTLKKDYPDPELFKHAVPELILRYNLCGLDIDLRATQIASLALWLRAQRAYQEMGLRRGDRPQITRSNIVCAEPMPGEKELLDEFIGDLQPKVLGQLVRVIFARMQLAGEAGTLLKIEDEIREAVGEAKRQWLARPRYEQIALFPAEKRTKWEQQTLFDLSGIAVESFWQEAEERVVEALRAYAKKAANDEEYRRRLFTDDTEAGFAFIDLCRRRYDVVLMNPPFGEVSKLSKSYLESNYPRTKNDVYAAFVERGINILQHRGMLGAITSRTGFFLSSFQKWREEILLKEAWPTVVADLGFGVLDTAMVETAAYCLEKC